MKSRKVRINLDERLKSGGMIPMEYLNKNLQLNFSLNFLQMQKCRTATFESTLESCVSWQQINELKEKYLELFT